MSDVERLLGQTRTIVLVDWPSRDVPDALACAGFTVISQDGPDVYNAYELRGHAVRIRDIGRPPERADLVYAHRPLDELPEIVELATSLGASAIWLQSGRAEGGAKDPRGCWLPQVERARAREIVERAGLRLIDSPYIGDAAPRR